MIGTDFCVNKPVTVPVIFEPLCILNGKLLNVNEELTYKKLSNYTSMIGGHAVAQFVERLRYKPRGRGVDSRWCHWNFSLT